LRLNKTGFMFSTALGASIQKSLTGFLFYSVKRTLSRRPSRLGTTASDKLLVPCRTPEMPHRVPFYAPSEHDEDVGIKRQRTSKACGPCNRSKAKVGREFTSD
jgi:hypothetical protein